MVGAHEVGRLPLQIALCRASVPPATMKVRPHLSCLTTKCVTLNTFYRIHRYGLLENNLKIKNATAL